MDNVQKKDVRSASTWLKCQASQFDSEIKHLLLYSVLQFSFQVAALFQLSYVVSRLVAESARPSVEELGVLALCFLGQYLMGLHLQWQKVALTQTINDSYQDKLNTLLKRKSLALIRDYSVATWQSFYINRIPALQNYFCDYLPQQKMAAVIPLLVLIVTLPFSWLVALLLFVSAPLIPLFMWIVGVGAASVHRQQFVAIERLSSLFLDRLNARQLLHIHKRVGNEREFFAEASDDLKNRTMKVVSLAFLSSSVLDFFSTIAMALVAVFVGFSLLGEIRFGAWQSGVNLHEGLFLLMLTPVFFKELKTLGRYYHTKSDAAGAAEDLMPVLCELENDRTHNTMKPSKLPLRLEDFRVEGRDGNPIISTKSLFLYEGDRVLLQGKSGSGKSTLLESLLGLRENSSVQGRSAIPYEDVAWLTQNPVITPESVRQNLCLSFCNARFSDEALLEAIKSVELDGWLGNLVNGLDTVMGDYPPVSGGQKQRLALARLILFDKPIIFLDEPSANLATGQKLRLESLIKRVFADKTLIWVTHDNMQDDTFFNMRWYIDDSRTLNVTTYEELACNA